MLYFRIHLYISIFLALLLCSCNNDIFVDRVSVPEGEITVDGNGGSQTFKITKKGLVGVKFDNDLDYRTQESYYDKEGNQLYNISNINDVAKITYSSLRFAIELQISGNDVKVTALDNTYDCDINIWALLNYGDYSKTINFIITPGAPLEVSEIFYGLAPLSETKIQASVTKLLRNNTSEPLKFSVYPYKDVKSTVNFTLDDSFREINSTVKTDLPLYINSEWKMFSRKNFVEVYLSYPTHYYAYGTDIDKVDNIEVPPYSDAVIKISMTVATMEVNISAFCQMPNSGISDLVTGKCSVSQPIDYKIEVKCEEQ